MSFDLRCQLHILVLSRAPIYHSLGPTKVGSGRGSARGGCYTYHGPPKPTCLGVFMVNNLVFGWPKPLFFMVLGAHGSYNPYKLPFKTGNWSYFTPIHGVGVGSREKKVVFDGFHPEKR